MWFLMSGISFEYLLMRIAAALVVVFLTLPIHEFSHAFVANKLGDDTAKILGRFSINPALYFDPIGAACVLLFGFGWGKPAPIGVSNFSNIRRDKALVCLAGPISSFLCAFIGGFILNLFIATGIANNWVYLFFSSFIVINLEIAIVNFIPLPSLDGFPIFEACVPKRLLRKFYSYQKVISITLIILLFFGAFSVPINILERIFYNFILKITFLPFGKV